MPFAQGNGENVFLAIFVCIGLTVIAFFVVLIVLVNPLKLDQVDGKADLKTPKHAKRLLISTAIASCLDSGGDVGTQMARSTIIMALFTSWATTDRQNILLLLVIVVAICAFMLLLLLRGGGVKLPTIATIGCFATLLTQVLDLNNIHTHRPLPRPTRPKRMPSTIMVRVMYVGSARILQSR